MTAVAAVETAGAVTETMTTAATAGVAAVVAVAAAAGMAAAVEAVAPLLLITEADHEGTTAHVPDLTHHVSLFDVKISSMGLYLFLLFVPQEVLKLAELGNANSLCENLFMQFGSFKTKWFSVQKLGGLT